MFCINAAYQSVEDHFLFVFKNPFLLFIMSIISLWQISLNMLQPVHFSTGNYMMWGQLHLLCELTTTEISFHVVSLMCYSGAVVRTVASQHIGTGFNPPVWVFLLQQPKDKQIRSTGYSKLFLGENVMVIGCSSLC